MQNEVIRNIYTRRSVRKYEDRPVPEYLIHELLQAAVMAPSARNVQPWHFSIVEGRDKIRYFGERAIEQRRLLGAGIKAGMRLVGVDSIFYNAPLLVFISGERDWKYLKDDTNLAVQNMFLAAHSLGLGSCWIGLALPLNNDAEARHELAIPDSHDIAAILIFGYPAQKQEKIPERQPKINKWLK